MRTPEQYQNGILIQAGLIGGLKGYVLTNFTLKEFCGRIMRLGPAIMYETEGTSGNTLTGPRSPEKQVGTAGQSYGP